MNFIVGTAVADSSAVPLVALVVSILATLGLIGWIAWLQRNENDPGG